ncbi:MSC_0623 family F1-like ATPase-associated protein [Candidatus Mycoplasma pogonae]
MKFLKKQKQKLNNDVVTTNDEYQIFLEQNNVILYTQLIGDILFANNIDFENIIYKNFQQKLDQALNKKMDIVFDDFVINWKNNQRLEQNVLVPSVSKHENPHTDAINFKSIQNNEALNSFFTTYNHLIKDFVIGAKKYVEVLNGIVIYISKETGSLKIKISNSFLN